MAPIVFMRCGALSLMTATPSSTVYRTSLSKSAAGKLAALVMEAVWGGAHDASSSMQAAAADASDIVNVM